MPWVRTTVMAGYALFAVARKTVGGGRLPSPRRRIPLLGAVVGGRDSLHARLGKVSLGLWPGWRRAVGTTEPVPELVWEGERDSRLTTGTIRCSHRCSKHPSAKATGRGVGEVL